MLRGTRPVVGPSRRLIVLSCYLVAGLFLAGLQCPQDNDGDGVEDSVDNCVSTPNTDQADSDADGIGDACDPDPHPASSLIGLSIAPAALGFCGSGQTSQLRLLANYLDGTQADLPAAATVQFVSSNPAVASVSGDGVVTSAGPGKTVITAKLGAVSAAAGVVVKSTSAQTTSTSFAASTAFLYAASQPRQIGVASCAIDSLLAAVIRGKVSTRDGQPLPGVVVTVLNHPEYGQTTTQSDGVFDMVVNGGGSLTAVYAKPGYLPAHRQADVPVNDYAWMPDVIMVAVDSQVTTVDLAADTSVQVARGSLVSDDDGSRQATLLFKQGSTAEMVLADGSTQSLSTLNVRATEFSVGSNGLKAMPAVLPPTSAYTYCVDLSADEALAAGATEVRFSKPQYFYVEDFVGFPVGSPVPAGYYDRQQGRWIPSSDGLVIQVLSITDGVADVDITGDDQADDAAALESVGITAAERSKLADLYPATPQRLWRVPITHFSPWDCNWPYRAPGDAEAPPEDFGEGITTVAAPTKRDPCRESGSSVIEVQTQVLLESVPVVGTPFTLNYRSDRVPAHTSGLTIRAYVSGASVPASLKRIEVNVGIAGRLITETLPAAANQSYVYTWDGNDVYGQPVGGSVPYTTRVGYFYDGVYTWPSSADENRGDAFGQFGGAELQGTRSRQEFSAWRTAQGYLGAGALREDEDFGGWTLSTHHSYDPRTGKLFFGNGRVIQAARTEQIINVVAGTNEAGHSGDGGPATAATLRSPRQLACDSDGNIYIADVGNHCIRRVRSNGVIDTVAGNGIAGFSGDGGPATQAQLNEPGSVAVGPDGALYIGDTANFRVRRVGPDGVITTFAGGGEYSGDPDNNGDGGPATAAFFSFLHDVDVGPDGSVFISEYGLSSNPQRGPRVRRVSNGVIATVAGGGDDATGDGILATAASISSYDGSIALAADGSLYIADTAYNRIRRVGPDGIIRTIAGMNSGEARDPSHRGDGQVALYTPLYSPQDIAVAPDGTVFFTEPDFASEHGFIRSISKTGLLGTAAGDSQSTLAGAPGSAAALSWPIGLATTADGRLCFSDQDRIRRLTPMSVSGAAYTDILVPSQDGTALYVFDVDGRHRETFDALSGALISFFTYDAQNRLIMVQDGDGNVTTIERYGNGRPAAIVGPFGQRTVLTLNGSNLLEKVTNPAGEAYTFGYTNGLLTTLTDARGAVCSYVYNDDGLLKQATDPVGGSKLLTRTETPNGYQLTMTTAEGVGQIYTVETTPAGEDRQISVSSCCGNSIALTGADGSQTLTFADGMVISERPAWDPRWGSVVPYIYAFSLTTPGGLQLVLSSSNSVNLADATDPLSVESQTVATSGQLANYTATYDAATRTATTTTPEGRQIAATIDSMGRVVNYRQFGLAAVRLSYDERSLLRTLQAGEEPDARTTTFDYDTYGYLSTMTDALSQTMRLTCDAVGRVTEVTLPDNNRIGRAYDKNGNLISITPPGRSAHVYTYNPVNLVETCTPPPLPSGPTVTWYTYDLDRHLKKITRPDGAVVNLAYEAGRLRTVSWPGGSISYTYNSASGFPDTITTADNQTITYHYDGALITSETHSGVLNTSLSYNYQAGQGGFILSTEVVGDGDQADYEYTDDGLLYRVSSTGAGYFYPTWDPVTRALTHTSCAGVETDMTWSSFGELNTISAETWPGGTSLFATQYQRDALGRIIELTETLGGSTRTYVCTYVFGQLTEVSREGVVLAQYAYDDNGNRTSYTDADGRTVSATYDAQDRLLQYGDTTYTYTKNGELASKTTGGQTTRYEYDPLGGLRQVELPNGKVIEYVIDGRCRRIGKKVNGVLTRTYLYRSDLQIVAELDASGNIISRFVYGVDDNLPEYMVRDGTQYRIVADHLGSPRVVIDGYNESVVQRMNYDAFGRVILDTNPGFQPFGFAGGLYDPDTGLVRFGARDYDAETGRWTCKDPLGLLTGTNPYVYVGNDPVNATDAVGLDIDYGALADKWWDPTNPRLDTSPGVPLPFEKTNPAIPSVNSPRLRMPTGDDTRPGIPLAYEDTWPGIPSARSRTTTAPRPATPSISPPIRPLSWGSVIRGGLKVYTVVKLYMDFKPFIDIWRSPCPKQAAADWYKNQWWNPAGKYVDSFLKIGQTR